MNLWIFVEISIRNGSAQTTDILIAVVLLCHILFMEQMIFRKIRDDSYITDDKY